jgi:hypothetical protein
VEGGGSRWENSEGARKIIHVFGVQYVLYINKYKNQQLKSVTTLSLKKEVGVLRAEQRIKHGSATAPETADGETSRRAK